MTDAKLQLLLPNDHPLLVMYSKVLAMTHPNQSEAVQSYLNIISRVFRFVTDWLIQKGRSPTHWSDLMVTAAPIIEYLDM